MNTALYIPVVVSCLLTFIEKHQIFVGSTQFLVIMPGKLW